MDVQRIRAYAKINVGLEILHKRADGYHAINSVFVPVTLYDELDIEPATATSVVCEPPVTTSPADNLVHRAMVGLQGLGHIPAKIRLRKFIPAGGGLGGGSSDAGTLLRVLGTGLPADELHTLACSLGSDVPFFLQPGIALVGGRGETVTPIDIPFPWTVLLVLPGIHIATAGAFARVLKSGEKVPTDIIRSIRQLLEISTASKIRPTVDIVNDFEDNAFEQHPELREIKHELYETNAIYASMSGSGSTMFGLYTSVDNARNAEARFTGSYRTYICHAAI